MLEDIWAVVKPWFFMSVSTTFFFITVAKLISEGDLDTLRSRKKFGEAWFGNLWRFIGPKAQAEASGWVIPLLEGRVENGRAAVKTNAVSHALEGVVLEVGAGSGMWTKVLADIALASETGEGRTPIKVYGVEPNPMSAAALKRRVEQLGLDGRYEVIPAGIQDLEKESPLKPGSVDCIMTVQCLCSIPEPEKNMRLLYEYLKKGGRWYVYEHVRADEGVFIPAFQSKLALHVVLCPPVFLEETLDADFIVSFFFFPQSLQTSSGSGSWALASCVDRPPTLCARLGNGRVSISPCARPNPGMRPCRMLWAP